MLSKSINYKAPKVMNNIKALFYKSLQKNLASKHSSSGSESDGEHHHDSHHHNEKRNFYEDRKMKEAMKLMDNVKSEVFDPLTILEKLREPIKSKVKTENKKVNMKSIIDIEKEYIDFLASAFESATLKKYPEYKTSLDEFKHLIPNYEQLNAYEREVKILDTYMHWSIGKLRDKSNTVQNGYDKASKAKAEFFNKITNVEESDSHIMKNLKKKLKKIIEAEAKYEQFKYDYSKELESKALERIVEKKKVSYSEIDVSNNKALSDLKSSLNPYYSIVSPTPHDHIDISNWKSNTNQLNAEKHKYLSLYDIILDQSLNRIRPENSEDDVFKYVKDSYKPSKEYYDAFAENTVFDYVCKMDGEFYIKAKDEIDSFFKNRTIEEDDPHRPTDRHWKDEYKYPHVADRLGWHELMEHPFDKNPFLERIDSIPLYQWMPFTQTPSINPDVDLDLELGEVLYEDKWAFEWALLMKLLLLVAPIGIAIFLIQAYENNSVPSSKLRSRYTFTAIFPGMMHENYIESNKIEKLVYWGSDMWYWQHWVRKFLFYPTALAIGAYIAGYLKFIGSSTVIKAYFNRSKDILFVWRPGILLGKKLYTYELHHLEKPLSSIVGNWNTFSYVNGNKNGYSSLYDTRTTDMFFFKEDSRYWNADVRKHFDDNTNTYWKGLRSKDVDNGIFFNNSLFETAAEQEESRVVELELKEAIKKHGPIQKMDYENNYEYQLKKRLYENKNSLLSFSH